tara:strand:- start:866 stop:1111 length:246 start_codon:yes stop_codon:yes gene_type:complete
MIWMDYTVEQFGENFTVRGDWPGEVMGLNQDGSKKDHWLYKPGDVFIVDENGILKKSDHLSALMMKYEEGKLNDNRTSNSD